MSRSRFRPRRIVLLLVASLVAIAIAGVGFAAVMYERAHVDTAGDVAFTTPLRVPPLAASRRDAQGRRVFDLELRRGETELRKGSTARTYGINGDYLGPTIRARRGERVLVNVRNALGESSTVHWHGMHLPAAMDGGPHQPIADGATWSPTWRIDQPAATLWYHPHPHGDTADQARRRRSRPSSPRWHPRAPADADTTTRSFELSSPRSINDESMQMDRIDFATERDRTEVWEVRNDNGLFHIFHVHDVQFRVLDVDGEPPPPELSGLKDTVAFPPDARMRLLVSFSDYADRNPRTAA